MVQPRRIARLEKLIKAKIARVLLRDMRDPRLGFITISRVVLDRELFRCKVYWSIIGDEKVRRLNEMALEHGRKFIQHEVAEVLSTRRVPRLEFLFDPSIAGSIRIQGIIDELNREREERERTGSQD